MLGLGMSLAKRPGKKTTPPTPPAPDYQPWENFPDSPVLTEDYPYQFVAADAPFSYLFVSTGRVYNSSGYARCDAAGVLYERTTGAWVFLVSVNANSNIVLSSKIVEANADIYTDSSLTTVYFAKTTDTSPAEPLYQPWENYPDSPVRTEDYPYQAIIFRFGIGDTLIYNNVRPFNVNGASVITAGDSTNLYRRVLTDGAWGEESVITGNQGMASPYIYEANNDIYTNSSLTTVYFAKTTD